MPKIVFIAIMCVMLSSCTIPETRMYALENGNVLDFDVVPGNNPVILTVQSPKHLSQPYIVTRKSEVEFSISRYSRWEESPQKYIQDVIQRAFTPIFSEVKISRSPLRGYYLLSIELKRFEKLDGGDGIAYANMSMNISLIDPNGRVLIIEEIRYKSEVEDGSYQGLAIELNKSVMEGLHNLKKIIRDKLEGVV